MNKQKIFFFLFTPLCVFALVWVWINKPHPNLEKVKSEATVQAVFLTQQYLTNEENANDNFKEKVIEVSGIIKQINFLNDRNNIILRGHNTNTNVLCDLNIKNSKVIDTLQIGQQIKIKGRCKGFLKDVILLNCVLVNITNNEKN